MGLADRFRQAVAAGRAAAAAGPDGPDEGIGLVVFGADADGAIARAADLPSGRRLVLITDATDPALYLSERFVTEHLADPALLAGHPEGLAADDYLRDRLALMVRKWRIGRLVLAGPAAQARADAWAATLGPEVDIRHAS